MLILFRKRIIIFLALALVVFLTYASFNVINKNITRLKAENVESVELLDPGLQFTPTHLSLDKNNTIWLSLVSLLGNHQLVKFNPQNNTKEIYGFKGEKNGGFFSAQKVSDNSVWLGFGNSLIEFIKQTKDIKTYKLPPVKYSIDENKIPKDPLNPQLSPSFSLIDLTLSNDQNDIWLTRRFANSITRFSIDEKKFYEYKLADEFGAPESIYTDNSGNLWLTVSISGDNSGLNESIVSHDRIGKYNISSRDFIFFNIPAEYLAIDKQNNIWFDDIRNNSVMRLDSKGKLDKRSLFSQLNPYGHIIINNDNDMFVASKGSILKLDAQSTEVKREYKIPLKSGEPIGIPPGADPNSVKDKPILPIYKDLSFDESGNLWLLIQNYGQIGLLRK